LKAHQVKPTAEEIADGMALLRRENWFAATTPDFQAAVLAQLQWQWFATGEAVTYGGDTDGGMVGIARGAVSIIPAIGPADLPMIHIAGAPYWLGSNPLVDHRPRLVSIIARTRCLVALAPRHGLVARLAENPGWWRFITLHVCEALDSASQVAADLLIPDSRRRCIAVLLRIAGCRVTGTVPAKVIMTRDELAGMANLSRQTISPILHSLADAGYITISYRSIVLNEPAALRNIADT
jgi:CRP/FNR family transcriptional regulator, cyclic AMP receptor protein